MRCKSDALRWVERVKNFYKSGDKRISLAEFTNPNGAFVEDRMFVYVLSCKGTMLSHGVNEKFVGAESKFLIEDFMDLKDKEIVETANSKGNGWVDYKWFESSTRKTLPKNVYFEKIDDVIICSGFYNVNLTLNSNNA
jgi:cytochrome c